MTGSARSCWTRARRPEEKAERRQAILEAAASLLRDDDLDAINMSAVARLAGLSKGNLYRYFATKEELFLELYRDDFERWTEDVVLRLTELGVPPNDATDDAATRLEAGRGVAAVLSAAVVAHPRLARLAAVLGTILERNVTADAVTAFKEAVNERALVLATALHAALPWLDGRAVLSLLAGLHALVAGLWPMGHPAPVLEAVLSRPDLAHMRIDYAAEVETATRALILGFLLDPPPP